MVNGFILQILCFLSLCSQRSKPYLNHVELFRYASNKQTTVTTESVRTDQIHSNVASDGMKTPAITSAWGRQSWARSPVSGSTPLSKPDRTNQTERSIKNWLITMRIRFIKWWSFANPWLYHWRERGVACQYGECWKVFECLILCSLKQLVDPCLCPWLFRWQEKTVLLIITGTYGNK